VSVIALGVTVSAGAVLGVLLVAVGIVLVRGLRASGHRRDLALALGVGACIASYTLVDKHGITHADPISYLELIFGLTASGYAFGTWRARGWPALRATVSVRTLVAGLGFFGSYVLVLAALRLAPAASVAAVRESSVVIATAWLAISGREHVGAGRLVGAVAVVAGIVLISLA
jgi:drug/metabolite transporter (DMT)-like permease